MAEPWLSLIGIGEDGLDGLTDASRAALRAARHVFGAPRHLALAGVENGTPWPVPFSTAPLLACRGEPTAALVSGDPFWFGAGGALMGDLEPGEWRAFPAPSTFSLAAARLGWKLEETVCLGLHAAPFDRARPHLAQGRRMIALLRDADAPRDFAAWLAEQGFGQSRLWVLQALGGPREKVRDTIAGRFDLEGIAAPVAVALVPEGEGIAATPGRPVEAFHHDGQISKPEIRAVTLAALAPRPGEHLWDIGGGSGAVSVEWCLAAPGATAEVVEDRPERAENIAKNARRFGVDDRIAVLQGCAPDVLPKAPPHAVFVGGGASEALLAALWERLPPGGRLVANAVTLETEQLLAGWHARHGGELARIAVSRAAPLGRFRGWQEARPVVQWRGRK